MNNVLLSKIALYVEKFFEIAYYVFGLKRREIQVSHEFWDLDFVGEVCIVGYFSFYEVSLKRKKNLVI